MSQVEDKDINDLVLTASQNITTYQYNFDGVCRKARKQRRNRYAAVGIAVALAVTAAIAIPAMLTRNTREIPPATPPLVHRIIVSGEQFKFPPGFERTPETTFETAPSGTTGVWRTKGELAADGTLKPLPQITGEQDALGADLVLTEDGGYVLSLGREVAPGLVEVENGQMCPNTERDLVVLNSAGTETMRRTIAKATCGKETPELLAADATYAYLKRAGKLLRHKLSDGVESVFLDIAAPLDPTGAIHNVNVYGRFAVIRYYHVDPKTSVPQDSPLRVVNLDTGATEGNFAFKADWNGTAAVDLSPDGQWLAFKRSMPQPGLTRPVSPTGLFIANVRTGEVRQLRVFPADGSTAYAGMGWATDSTLRVAWFDVPSDRLVRLGEVLHTTDYPL